MTMDWSQVKGFNYQPSYARNGYEVWHDFDAATISTEIGRGVKYFPRMNALRIWVAWEYFVHHPQECEARFEQWLGIADGYGLKVMPCLFNRWHSGKPDYGGIYIDHLLRGVTWGHKDILFRPYLEAIVGQHAWDPRIIGWDLCNEPFTYWPATIPNIEQAEYEWLEELYRTCKQLGAQAPLSIGVVQMHGKAGLERVEPLSDVLGIHPYWFEENPPPVIGIAYHSIEHFERMLDEYQEVATRAGKPLLVTECCWGSLDDQRRASNVRQSLRVFKERGLGYLVYLLHHSLVADAHKAEFGAVAHPGSLAFIEADGSLRAGHEVFNEF